MQSEIALQPVHRQLQEIRSGAITSRELLERYISRIETIDNEINAVVTRDFQNSRRKADESDAATADGRDLGVLHGIPATIKDAIETRGLRSTGGAIELSDHVPKRDAPVVRSIKAEGSYVIAKTNLPAWSGDMRANNEIFGRTNNPWNLEYGPGGSSGGAAAAVASGMSSFDIGTDVGGSIRLPASFCGVFGHKPSHGIVPSTGYLNSAESLRPEVDSNVFGPIARSAEDLDLLLTVMLARTPPLVTELDEAAEDPSSLRIAAWLDDPGVPVDQEVLEVLTRAINSLESKAAIDVNRSARPEFDLRSASDVTQSILRTAHAGPNSEVTHYEWLQMNRERLKLRNDWADFFARYDIILMPVCVVPPFPHLDEEAKKGKPLRVNGERREYSDALRWTTVVGQCLLPSTVAPVGLGRSGLPVGIQVVGRYGADRNTISFAGFLSSICGGYVPPPIAVGEHAG